MRLYKQILAKCFRRVKLIVGRFSDAVAQSLVLLSDSTLQGCFRHIEKTTPIGWANTGEPQNKFLTHPQAELGLLHLLPCEWIEHMRLVIE